MRGWMCATTGLAAVVTIAQLRSSSPSGSLGSRQAVRRPANANGSPVAARDVERLSATAVARHS